MSTRSFFAPSSLTLESCHSGGLSAAIHEEPGHLSLEPVTVQHRGHEQWVPPLSFVQRRLRQAREISLAHDRIESPLAHRRHKAIACGKVPALHEPRPQEQVVDLWLAAVGHEKAGVLDEKISRYRAHDR